MSMNQAEKDSRRSYQDTPHPDFRKHVGIWADLERLRPRGDCVVIRVMPEPEQHANLIWIPERARNGGNEPRVGEVVAIGLGDRLFTWECKNCAAWLRSTWHRPKQCACGSREYKPFRTDRHPMNVKLGDTVLYWRVVSNQLIINDIVFQIIREEQHILAVLEKEPEGVSLADVHAHDREMIQRGDWMPLEKESNGARN